MKKVVITGGLGFIGSHIAEECVRQNFQVKIIDNLSTGSFENISVIKDSVDFVEGDIRDLDFLEKEFKGADFVIHQAALVSVPESIEFPILSDEINSKGTLNVLESARRNNIKRVVYASSSAVYGNPEKLPVEEGDKCLPLSPYALQKKNSEDYAKLYGELYGIESVGLRYFNVFGPRQRAESSYAGVIPLFIKALIENKDPRIYGDGSSTRDFVFVKDVARANILACEASIQIPANIVNVGSGQGISIKDLFSCIAENFNKDTQPLYEPARKGDIVDSVAQTAQAKELLNFIAKTSFKEGLKETVEWYRKILTS